MGSRQTRFVQIESDPKKRGAGKTVLVVDDNPAIRKLLASVFYLMFLQVAEFDRIVRFPDYTSTDLSQACPRVSLPVK